MELIYNFFTGINYQELIAYAMFVLFGLAPGFSLFNWLKAKLKVEDKGAHALVVVASLVITALSMFLTGSLGLEGFEFTLENIISFGLSLYAASQFAYQAFKNSQPPPLEEYIGKQDK